MKVIADSHAIFWYVRDMPNLSNEAAAALDDAAVNGGIGVSVVTLTDLWYVTQKATAPISMSAYEAMKTTILGHHAIHLLPFTVEAAIRAEVIEKNDLNDPFDRMIAATALERDVPLITADKRITDLNVVKTIW